MTARTDECAALWGDELHAISSILGNDIEFEPFVDGLAVVKLTLKIDIQPQTSITLDPEDGVTSNMRCKIQISHLPNIHLQLSIPSLYPLDEPARITSLNAQLGWIDSSSIAKLTNSVYSILQDSLSNGEGVLWRLYEFFHDGEALDRLGMRTQSTSANPCIGIRSQEPTVLAAQLLAFNVRALTELFEAQSFSCPICLETVKGVKCLKLSGCGHVACRPCLKDYWSLHIQQGEVGSVGCVDPDCVRKTAKNPAYGTVDEDQVHSLVGNDLTSRWLALKLKRSIESDPTIVRCPLQGCQAPVPQPPLSNATDADEGWNRLRTCPSCDYSFCVLCRKTWHGPIAGCQTSATAELLESYLAEPADSPVRQRLDRQFGKKTLKKMLDKYLETKANQEWLSKSTQKCPGCDTAVEKSEGCNHMKCGRCQMHFCYRCGIRLRADNPYSHFSTRDSPCYGSLFDFRSDPTDLDWQPLIAFEMI